MHLVAPTVMHQPLSLLPTLTVSPLLQVALRGTSYSLVQRCGAIVVSCTNGAGTNLNGS